MNNQLTREVSGKVSYFVVKPNEALKVYDPVTVYLTDHGDGRGQLVVVCYDMAWQAYFGAMGDRTIAEFVGSCSAGYLANKMQGQFGVRSKRHEKYREQIVAVIQAALASANHQEYSK